jgi:transcriptional regulator with XRE-family HTH domain
MTFGKFLKKLREEKDLGIRELARLSGQDAAYIYRLEAGEKSSPSDEVLKSLIRSLKPEERRQRVLRLLAERGEVDDVLVELVLSDTKIVVEDFESAAGASFRENRPETEEQWRRYIAQIKNAREEFERG